MSADWISTALQPLPELQHNQVQLWWLADIQAIPEQQLDGYRQTLLSEAERLREASFLGQAARRQYLLGRVLLRTVLSGYTGVAATRLEFELSANGKPELAAHCNHEDPLRFNLTHTADQLLLAVTRGRRVGIDLELCRERQISTGGLFQRLFDADEQRLLESVPPAQRAETFCSLWALKESYVKALGSSLLVEDCRAHFGLDGQVIAARQGNTGATISGWLFQLYQPCDGMRMALCVENSGDSPLTCQVRQMAPAGQVAEVVWPMLSCSTPAC